jgi:hypothetical protein
LFVTKTLVFVLFTELGIGSTSVIEKQKVGRKLQKVGRKLRNRALKVGKKLRKGGEETAKWETVYLLPTF